MLPNATAEAEMAAVGEYRQAGAFQSAKPSSAKLEAAIIAGKRAYARAALLSIRDGGMYTAHGRMLLLDEAIEELESTS